MYATYLGLVLMLAQFILFAAMSPSEAGTFLESVGIWRAGGTLIPATQLAGVAGCVFVLTLVDILAHTPLAFAKTTLALAATVLMASLGRGGMLATGVSTMIALAAFRRLRLMAIVILSLAILTLAWPSLLDTSWDILSRRQGADELSSLTGRVPVWEVTLRLISMRPLLGWGFVAGGRVGLLTPIRGWYSGGSHNAYLEVLLSLGLFGALIVSALLWKTCRGSISCFRFYWNVGQPGVLAIITLKVLTLIAFVLARGLLEGSFAAPKFEAIILIGAVFAVDQLNATRRLVP